MLNQREERTKSGVGEAVAVGRAKATPAEAITDFQCTYISGNAKARKKGGYFTGGSRDEIHSAKYIVFRLPGLTSSELGCYNLLSL